VTAEPGSVIEAVVQKDGSLLALDESAEPETGSPVIPTLVEAIRRTASIGDAYTARTFAETIVALQGARVP
jgi:hypothetical protein